nr:MAG TPA: hypothetical protein [Caudoviricetes sp.]
MSCGLALHNDEMYNQQPYIFTFSLICCIIYM